MFRQTNQVKLACVFVPFFTRSQIKATDVLIFELENAKFQTKANFSQL